MKPIVTIGFVIVIVLICESCHLVRSAQSVTPWPNSPLTSISSAAQAGRASISGTSYGDAIHALSDGNYALAEQSLRKQLSGNPGDMECQLLLAYATSREGRADEAISEYSAVLSPIIEGSPNGTDYLPGISSNLTAIALYQLCLLECRSGDWKIALAAYNHATSEASDSSVHSGLFHLNGYPAFIKSYSVNTPDFTSLATSASIAEGYVINASIGAVPFGTQDAVACFQNATASDPSSETAKFYVAAGTHHAHLITQGITQMSGLESSPDPAVRKSASDWLNHWQNDPQGPENGFGWPSDQAF